MSRRPHKKSRNGCADCKRRHVRCDGSQPICINCSSAELRCSFLNKDTPFIIPYAVPVTSPKHRDVTTPRASLAPSHPCGTTALPDQRMKIRDAPDFFSVNMTHIELFNNLSSHEFLIAETEGHTDIPTSIFIKYALTSSYLMHQCLASSALQLSATRPESRFFYRGHSTELQNRALSLFNEGHKTLEMTAENCIHMFLFSSLIGVHVMSDTLLHERRSLEEFIDVFTQGLYLYRGVLTIVQHGRHFLRETEMAPYLESKSLVKQITKSRFECHAIENFLSTADLPPSSREAYLDAVAHLQRAFDVQSEAQSNRSQIPVVLLWPILVPSMYVEMVRLRRAEALVILAYYAILIHRGRHLWIFGDGGRFLIESISNSLGPAWQGLLEFPNAILREESSV